VETCSSWSVTRRSSVWGVEENKSHLSGSRGQRINSLYDAKADRGGLARVEAKPEVSKTYQIDSDRSAAFPNLVRVG
jgi:hypothetical protein